MAGQDAPDRCLDALKQDGPAVSPWVEAYMQRQTEGAPSARHEGAKGNFEPPEKVDGVFAGGEHTVTSGVYIAQGDSKVQANGNAVVYASEHSRVEAKDQATVFASGKSTAEMSGDSVLYARDEAETYGFDNALVYASGSVQVFAHDKSLNVGVGHSVLYANDNATACAFDNTFVWPRSPKPPDDDKVFAFDNSVVASDDRMIDGKVVPLPQITLHDNATWVETETQFHNPVVHRQGNTGGPGF